MKAYSKLKNIAIVAHVDHGKTTLVDALLKQSDTFDAREQVADRVMDSGDIEKERGITITAKNCAFVWKDTKINLLDTPGHADFGGEVERSIMMVDGVLLLVDASEGPLPQTRFVLQKAMARGLKIGVLINKIDRPDERITEVIKDVEDLFIEMATMLEISDFDLDIPFFYACARDGWATVDPKVKTDNLNCLLDFITSDFYPQPKTEPGEDLRVLVTNLSYSPYLGPLMIGRIQRGSIKKNQNFTWVGWRDEAQQTKQFKITSVQVFDALKTRDVEEAKAGEIVIMAGFDHGYIGDSICSTTKIEPLPRIEVEPPTVSIFVSVSTSPLSGQEGEYLTSRKLEEFLINVCRTNVALKYAPTDDPKVFELKGRGELQLSIVLEEIRRKDFELMASRPQVLFATDENGQKTEPYELVVLDIPSECTGAITEKLSVRKGFMKNLLPIGDTRTRLEFEIPSRGLIGYRSTFLTDTKGSGLMSSQFLGYKLYAGDMLARVCGAVISDRAGKTTMYALFNLLSSGRQFVKVGEQVYEGQVVGESTRSNDINVNVVREKHVSAVRTAGKDENMVVPPMFDRTLEWALDFIDNDEWVEITPKSIRIRKKILPQNLRTVRR
jgi:GTP-binding protein